MIDDAKVSALLSRVARDVDEGILPAAQIAVAHHNEVVVDATYGAPDDSRFCPFSCTKAIVNAAVWRLVGDGSLDLTERVATYVPAFASNGKDVVTVEQVLLHVGGFPMAPLGPEQWDTREGRLEAFAKWRLTLTPGETYMYHPVAGHWVLAEIVETLSGQPYADAIETLVTEPLGLPRLLGIAVEDQAGVVDTVGCGTSPTPDEMEEAFGFRIDLAEMMPPEVALNALLTLNSPEARAVGVPGGGGVVRARDLALMYQGFLHNPDELWDPVVLEDATATIRNTLTDVWGAPANRTRGGMVVKGDDGFGHRRGFGRTASARSFGHNGAGGQIAFVDPVSGLSVAYVTNGLDQHLIRQLRRDTAIASRAADILAP